MEERQHDTYSCTLSVPSKGLIVMLILLLVFPFNLFSQAVAPAPTPRPHNRPTRHHPESERTPVTPDSIVTATQADEAARHSALFDRVPVLADSIGTDSLATDTVAALPPERLKAIKDSIAEVEEFGLPREYSPDPTRAVWMSALFPGLGQLYNRRYWKLPVVVGAFMGLGYATSWNNRMLSDYTRAYRDIMDSDPSTNSYMDFYPPTTNEADLNKTWLTNTLKSRRDYYRRNRDLCIVCIVGVYLLAIVDAYVDASLSHFDISPDLSMQVAPTIIPDSREKLPSVGVQWAINF